MIIKCDENESEFNLPLGWLSPTGEFIKCSLYDHIAAAEEIVKKYKYSGSAGPVDDYLIGLGWVHVSMSLMGERGYSIYWDTSRHLSNEQFSFLQKYFEDKEKVCWFTQVRWDRECDER